MTDDRWPEEGIELLQAIADTKFLLGHRFAQWTLAGDTLEDGIGGAALAQEEIGHVRQLFAQLEGHDREMSWLEGDRDPEAFANAAPLDAITGDWESFIATVGPVDRAAWYLLDSITVSGMQGLIAKIGEDEYFHLEYLDARLETLAEDDPETIQAVLEHTIPGTLAFLGPGVRDEADDPLLASEFTDRSTAELRGAFREHYETVLDSTGVSLDSVDWSAPDPVTWNGGRRRIGGGGISEEDIRQLRGERNAMFATQ